jgi:phosphatidylserine decarboxylase
MAKEGLAFFLPALIVTVIVWGFWIISAQLSLLILGFVTLILTIFFGIFFRDPDRLIPSAEGLLVSPADGFISAIKTLQAHPYVGEGAVQISIFLTILDVHVNRIPISGVIESIDYKSGKFMVAYKDHASEENEQTEINLLTTDSIKIAFRQIAGQLARRIVCRLNEGQKVKVGERFGMIKFGSRTDLIVPADTKIEVEKGQHVKGGETIIAKLTTAPGNIAEQSHSEKNNA